MTQKLGWIVLIAVGLLPIGLFSSSPAMFLSAKAITMVLVGTLGVAMASRKVSELKAAVAFLWEALGSHSSGDRELVAELDRGFTQLHRQPEGIAAVEQSTRSTEFRYVLSLLAKRVDAQAVVDLLERKSHADANAREAARQCFTSLAKFPPALGLLATVLAMINVLENMSGGNMGVAGLGPAMAAGLVATFYGIALSNLLLSPAAEAIGGQAERVAARADMVAAALELYLTGRPPIVIREALLAMHSGAQRTSKVASAAKATGADTTSYRDAA